MYQGVSGGSRDFRNGSGDLRSVSGKSRGVLGISDRFYYFSCVHKRDSESPKTVSLSTLKSQWLLTEILWVRARRVADGELFSCATCADGFIRRKPTCWKRRTSTTFFCTQLKCLVGLYDTNRNSKYKG